MQYRKDKYGNEISVLGYGCMRFTKKGLSTDIEKAEKEVSYAVKSGINYFDTAYSYSGNEVALGEILKRTGLRDKVYIATKLPQYLVRSEKAIDKYFSEELTRLQTDHIDYYMMHMLTDIAAWEKLIKFGIEDWITEKKNSGEIRNIGFSFHGNSEMFVKILNAYDWDFCQIQYNYLDEDTQAGRTGLKAAAEKGIPVIIMEPLRGGKLVDMLPQKAKKIIDEDKKKQSAAEIAFRWLYDQPEVTCVLSGMNSIEMIDENCRIASDAVPGHMEEYDFELIKSVKDSINASIKVPCTGCGYCMPCAHGVDIPTIFSCYNHMFVENKNTGRFEYMQMMAFRKTMQAATNCVNCGACVAKCPQNINIPVELKKADKALRPWYMKVIVVLMRIFKFW